MYAILRKFSISVVSVLLLISNAFAGNGRIQDVKVSKEFLNSAIGEGDVLNFL